MTPHYTINIEWSDEDASFIATVPQLPGCMADGPTEEAALAEAKRAIQDWLETARAINRPIPLPPPTIESLARASALLNKSAIARLIGLEQRTLNARIKTGRPSLQRKRNVFRVRCRITILPSSDLSHQLFPASPWLQPWAFYVFPFTLLGQHQF